MLTEILVVPTRANLDMLKSSAQVLARTLAEKGMEVSEEISLCPDRRRLQHAVSRALDRAELVVILGGMGRDSGFITKQIVSEGLGLTLENSREALEAIREFCLRTGIPSGVDDMALASLPAGSRALIPTKGVIPGCMISSASQHIVMLPENEGELIPMLTRQVMPMLARAGFSITSEHELRTFGATEGQVRQLIIDLMGTTNPIVTTNIDHGETVVRVVAQGENQAEAANTAKSVLRTIAGRLGDYAYGLDVPGIDVAAISKLNRKRLSLAVAESGTNRSVISKIITVPNGEMLLKAGVTADNISEKKEKLGLNSSRVKKSGEVSEYTAVHMANAIRERSNSDIGLAVCANFYGKPSKKQQSGLVYIAVCDDKNVYVKKLLTDEPGVNYGEAVLDATISHALNMLRLFVDYLPDRYPSSIPLSQAISGKVTVTDKDSYEEMGDYDVVAEPVVAPKERKSGGFMRTLVLVIAFLMIIGGVGYFALVKFWENKALTMQDDLKKVYAQAGGLVGLRAINSDTVGYIKIDGTEIEYPVVQHKDDIDYYYRRDFSKEYNNRGVIYMDPASNPAKPSDNISIYGHNFGKGGNLMFDELVKYRKLDFYKEHPTIFFETFNITGALTRGADYKVFAVVLTSATPSHFENDELFAYHKFVNAESKDDYNSYIEALKVRSLINIPVDVKAGDELITLTTCEYDLDDLRLVVFARKVRMGEGSAVDVEQAEINPTPLYPDYWYRTYGGTKPDVTSWNYKYTLGAVTAKSPDPDKQSVEPAVPEKPAEKEEELTDPDTKVEIKEESEAAAEKAAADKAAADKAAADKAAAEKAAAEKAAADKAAADKAAADKVAADKAAADKAAADKATADKAAADKAAAETEAIAGLETALAAEKAAESHYISAENAGTKADSTAYAEKAKAEATKAETAAKNAATAAGKSGSDTAKTAANDASKAAISARQLADEAVAIAQSKSDESTQPSSSSGDISGITLRVNSNVSYDKNDPIDILAKVVQQEMGPGAHTEALKAQTVATYTFILEANAKGQTPTVPMTSKADTKVINAVKSVLGEAAYYNGKYAFTPYFAISPGVTTSSASVWGGNYPYLVSVDSSYDYSATGYERTKTMSGSEVEDRIYSNLGINVSGDPSTWFEVTSYIDGEYNGNMLVCGESRSGKTGSNITGRLVRETVLNLRSASFDVSYNSSTDTFTFTTYGYGHGVGMSQAGANGYANNGWDYIRILEHYYTGVRVS